MKGFSAHTVKACERCYFERHTGNAETTVNVAGMLLMWQQVVSLSVLSQNHSCVAQEIDEPLELKCCVAADKLLTSVSLVLCGCSNLF